jgi:hypothetical protein
VTAPWKDFSWTKPIEFPPNSGQIAEYTPEERAIMREFALAVKDGRITREQMMAELQVIVDAKVHLGATVSNKSEHTLECVATTENYERTFAGKHFSKSATVAAFNARALARAKCGCQAHF